MFCLDIPEPIFLIFSTNTPQLLYYSHVPTAIVALLVGCFVFYKNRSSLLGKLLLLTGTLFCLWSFLDLILWTNVASQRIMFSWSIINLIEMLVSVSTIYFSYVFLEKKDVSINYKIFFGSLLAVFAVLIPTSFNIPSFDILNCEAEQGLLIYYFYALEVFFLLWLSLYLLKKIITAKNVARKMVIFFAIGVFCFLASFSGANILGSLTDHWEILQYGLFGMPIFMALLAYLIIEYKVFNIKLLGAQALVISTVILIGSQFFFIRNRTNQILTAITLGLVAIFGWVLVRSVKKEVEQREKLEKITNQLQRANLKLKELDELKTEFISIASHQLRTPLSIIKGYTSLIEDGAYGVVNKKERTILHNIDLSNERLIKLVDEFLNVSRIEQGRTQFRFVEMNIVSLVEEVITELKEKSNPKNIKLILQVASDMTKIIADEEKIRHCVFNLIDNAIKYSPVGSKIKVVLEKKNDGLNMQVFDAGVGLDKKDLAQLFQKFYRSPNVMRDFQGTGLGLFVVKQFIEAHHGKVWAKSAGVGKGSVFGFWIPAKSK